MAGERRTITMVGIGLLLTAIAIIAFLAIAPKNRTNNHPNEPAATTPPDPTENYGTLQGHVRNAGTDAPVPLANVTAVGSEYTTTTTTDHDGNFTLRLPDGIYTLIPEADGLRNAGRDDRGLQLRAAPQTTFAGIVLQLYEPCTLAGRVLSGASPLEANILISYKRDGSGAEDYDVGRLETDLDGYFHANGLAAGTLNLQVVADAFAPASITDIELWPGDHLDLGEIPMLPGANINGRIASASTQAPVQDALVQAITNRGKTHTTHSDHHGFFAIQAINADFASLHISAPAFKTFTTHVDLVQAGDRNLSVSLEPSVGLTLRILAPDGLPAQHATVQIWTLNPNEAPQTYTFTGADIALPDLSDGPFRIVAQAENGTLNANALAYPGDFVALTLKGRGTITGLVLSHDGNIATNAQVRLVESANEAIPTTTPWSPTQGGRFSFPGLNPGTYHIEAQDSGHRPTHSPPISLSFGDQPSITIRLHTGGTLSGTVRNDANDDPIPNAVVSVEGHGLSVATNAQGQFTLSQLPSGRFSIQVDASGYKTALASGIQVGDDERAQRDFRLSHGENQLELVGIGVQIRSIDGRHVVSNPLPNSPAARAGLQDLDVILAVNGESTENMPLRILIESIRGEEGSAVRLRIQRDQAAPFEVVIERQRISYP